ncbi:teneurin-3-like [Neocloeon triangulifer]|uniref:teneurin-3-like n=1 Tax=Neocloeon triangulifer TaxID=2078957 RepID=UPI00286F10B3|nr:teneurin-3-like [Neocloeon triangulifer]
MQARVLLVLLSCVTFTLAAINDPCAGPADCADVANAVCDLSVGQCVCDTRYVFTTDGTCEGAVSRACIIDHGKACNAIPYALCSVPSLLTCDCTNDYLISDDRTSCNTPEVGGHCLDNAQCSGLGASSCVDERCVCDAGHVEGTGGGRCYPISTGLYERCENDAQCVALHPGATCQGLIGPECRCAGRFIENASNTTCVEISPQIGDFCEVPIQCRDPNSSCLGGTCQCNSGYVASIDQVNCIPQAAVGGSCFQNQQCQSGSCVGGVCS